MMQHRVAQAHHAQEDLADTACLVAASSVIVAGACTEVTFQ